MPSIVRTTSPQTSHITAPKNRFRTVLGFSTLSRDSSDTDPPIRTDSRNLTFTRQSIDTARSYANRRKKRADRGSVAHISFFQRDLQSSNTTTFDNNNSIVDLTLDDKMTVDNTLLTRRNHGRVDQDGPWSVSVAETPHDPQSYSLYINTPTHNLTLTRTAKEIIELDRKLRETIPGVKLPASPIDMQSLPLSPPKRKSTFLNTLSRLASPTSVKTSRHASSSRRSNNASVAPSATPLTSPSGEINDPFMSFTPSAIENSTIVTPSAVSTGIAAYLTTISNMAGLRQARVWKRFVRVRTDDLESVRVERAIKRVRSDLAAHVGGLAKDKENIHKGSTKAGSIAAPSETGIILEERVNGIETHDAGDDVAAIKEEVGRAKETQVEATASVATENIPEEALHALSEVHEPNEVKPAEDAVEPSPAAAEECLSTPVATEAPARIPRSHSVDFDQSRISRAFASSTPSRDGASSQTGDESSISTTGGSRHAARRKKRSQSTVPKEPKKSHRKVVIDDFEMMRVLGKGCAGKVLLVRQKTTSELYALKAITKRHVLAHQELQHTLTEQAVLKRMAAESKDPFVVKLWWSFHDKENLFLVMDFHPGGDLATQLARWGRLGRDRARFYAAEIVEGCEGLHAAGVIYRDLKPENILIGADGHIVLTDFGLSKEFPRKVNTQTAPPTPRRGGEFYSSVPGTPQPTSPPWMMVDSTGELAFGWPGQVGRSDSTTTFCGTAEYLAPEVIQGLPYSYEVDWWSFGTMLYEMLTGITPFWANNHSDMYVRVLQDELQFPEDRAIDQDTKSLIRGLLQRNPALRICEPRIKKHPYFSMIDWSHVYYKRYIPPYIPPIDPSNASDTQNFDDTFLDMEPVLDDVNDDQIDTDQEPDQTDTDRTDGEESNTTPSQSRSSSIRPREQAPVDASVDVFDGYSFKGRHSVLIDCDEDEEDDGSEEDSGDGDDEDILSALEPLDTAPLIERAVVPDDTIAEVPEPKTPEARPVTNIPEPAPEVVPALPLKEVAPAAEEPSQAVAVPVEEPKPRKSKDLPTVTGSEGVPPAIPEKEPKAKPVPPPKAPVPRPTNRFGRTRREKSGVPALDRYLSDAIDEDTEATEREEDEDDDWDFVEAADGEDRNGAKGNSLFARGVVDRYRLAVFRKASTPSNRSAPRSFSGMSKSSETTVNDVADSPSPTQRRGRTGPGLTFRKHPRQFLRPKSPPPSSFSSKSSATAKSMTASTSNTLSAGSTGGLLTPSPSFGSTLSHSLKSKESALSVGAQSLSSEQSANGDSGTAEALPPVDTIRGTPLPEEPEKQKNKKLKKYKENAEKVFSLFSSPRQPS
ncbi:RAC family serine/threonine-protein kinase [Hypsizygus marmoreus]|uniref:non-specific serine/threonine protein kinase n=1 Tax=Hypsizygus marmoreus TaxID=39966 RepID=A0A369K7A5_HYPMA|nr:RAC family serine/threonine-protein kinase [Hypsizygus marmoreus]